MASRTPNRTSEKVLFMETEKLLEMAEAKALKNDPEAAAVAMKAVRSAIQAQETELEEAVRAGRLVRVEPDASGRRSFRDDEASTKLRIFQEAFSLPRNYVRAADGVDPDAVAHLAVIDPRLLPATLLNNLGLVASAETKASVPQHATWLRAAEVLGEFRTVLDTARPFLEDADSVTSRILVVDPKSSAAGKFLLFQSRATVAEGKNRLVVRNASVYHDAYSIERGQRHTAQGVAQRANDILEFRESLTAVAEGFPLAAAADALRKLAAYDDYATSRIVSGAGSDARGAFDHPADAQDLIAMAHERADRIREKVSRHADLILSGLMKCEVRWRAVVGETSSFGEIGLARAVSALRAALSAPQEGGDESCRAQCLAAVSLRERGAMVPRFAIKDMEPFSSFQADLERLCGALERAVKDWDRSAVALATDALSLEILWQRSQVAVAKAERFVKIPSDAQTSEKNGREFSERVSLLSDEMAAWSPVSATEADEYGFDTKSTAAKLAELAKALRAKAPVDEARKVLLEKFGKEDGKKSPYHYRLSKGASAL